MSTHVDISDGLLFPVVGSLSPRLAWMKKHGVIAAKAPNCGPTWCAWLESDCAEPGGIPNVDLESCGYGNTETEAMADLAVKRNIPLWNEEGGA